MGATRARFEGAASAADLKFLISQDAGIYHEVRWLGHRRTWLTRLAGRRHVLSGAPAWRAHPVATAKASSLALAGNGDVFDATDMGAIAAWLGNRAGYFVGVYPPVGRRLGEIPRLAIGMGGVGATFVASGQALVDAISVGLVGDDENAAVRQCRRAGEEAKTGEKR